MSIGLGIISLIPLIQSNDNVEATIHFTLLCQEYAIHRNVLLGKVTPICASNGVDRNILHEEELLTLLLCGNDAFNDISNRNIFSAAVVCNKSTNRFS